MKFEELRDPCHCWRGTLSILPQLEMRPYSHVVTLEESWAAPCTLKVGLTSCGNMRDSLRSPSQLEKHHMTPPAPMRVEAWFPCSELRATPLCFSHLERRLDFPEATCEVPWVQPQLEVTATTWEDPRVPHLISRWGLTPLQWLQSNPTLLLTTQKETLLPWGNKRGSLRSPSGNSRGTQSFRPQLEKNHEIPPKTWDEALFPWRALKEILSSQSKCKWLYATQEVPQNTCQNLRRTPSFPSQLAKNPVFPTSSRDEGRFSFFNLRGIPTFPLHLNRRPFVKRTASFPSTRDKAWFPCTNSDGTPSMPSQHNGTSTSLLHL